MTKSPTLQVFAILSEQRCNLNLPKVSLRVRERLALPPMLSQTIWTYYLVALLPVAMAGVVTCVRPAGEWTGLDQVPT